MSSISGDAAISSIKSGLVAPLEGAVEADTGDGLALGREAKEEQGDAAAIFEILAAKGALEAVVAVDALGLVEVHLPQVGPLEGVVALESDCRRPGPRNLRRTGTCD